MATLISVPTTVARFCFEDGGAEFGVDVFEANDARDAVVAEYEAGTVDRAQMLSKWTEWVGANSDPATALTRGQADALMDVVLTQFLVQKKRRLESLKSLLPTPASTSSGSTPTA